MSRSTLWMNGSWRTIDEAARIGFRLVRDDDLIAIARWNGTEFEHGSGTPIGFMPCAYWVPPGSSDASNGGMGNG